MMRINMKALGRSLVGLLILSIGMSSCGSNPAGDAGSLDVVMLVRAGRFDQAVLTAQKLSENNPENQLAKRDLRDAKMALLMSQGRTLTLDGRTEEGLQLFYKAQGLDAHNEVVRDWINKARIQLAEDTLTQSGKLTAREELAERRDLLLKVIAFIPENENSKRVENLRFLASSSLERVEENLAYCETRGKECFEAGLGSLAHARLHESLRDFSESVLYDNSQEEAIERYRSVNILVGEEFLEQALEYERTGLFDAARMDFERVHAKDPSNEEAIQGLNRMELEVRVKRILDEAEMAMLRGTPEMARELLDEAETMTVVQKHLVDGMRVDMRNAAWEKQYQSALALESEGSLPEAAAAYGELLESAETYKEADIRKEILEEFIAKAAELYGRAAKAENAEDEYSLLSEIEILWPAYSDVKERAKALRESLESEENGDGMDGESAPRRPMDRKPGPGEDNAQNRSPDAQKF